MLAQIPEKVWGQHKFGQRLEARFMITQWQEARII